MWNTTTGYILRKAISFCWSPQILSRFPQNKRHTDLYGHTNNAEIQVSGFKSGRSRRIFKGEKILSTPSFGGGVKLSVPCRRFTACKRTLECIVEVGISRQNYRSSFSPTNSSTFRCFELSRRVRRGETSGSKSGNRIPYRAGTISHQAAVHPKYTLGALNMKEEHCGVFGLWRVMPKTLLRIQHAITFSSTL
jgi:hypothetical protein